MSIQLEIPDSIANAIHLPEQRLRQELLIELAIALYAQNLLSFGKARALVHKSKHEFGRLLSDRDLARHYGHEELADDLAYARHQ